MIRALLYLALIRHIERTIKSKLNIIDWLIIKKLLLRNIKKSEQSYIMIHEKKLRNLTTNRRSPFGHEEVVKNLSTKNSHLRNDADKLILKVQLSHLANSYAHNYQPSRWALVKHCILKTLHNDEEIVILRSDKGSGIVVLNRRDYEKSIKNLINDKTKFKELTEDVTIKRESKLQRFLPTLRNNKCLDDIEYEKNYPCGSSPAKFMGHLRCINLLILTLFLTFVLLFLPLVLTITIFPNIFVNTVLLIYQMNFAQQARSHLWKS